MENTKLAVDISTAAKMLSVSRPTMYQILNRSDFTGSFRIGTKHLVSVAALQAWIAKQTEETA